MTQHRSVKHVSNLEMERRNRGVLTLDYVVVGPAMEASDDYYMDVVKTRHHGTLNCTVVETIEGMPPSDSIRSTARNAVYAMLEDHLNHAAVRLEYDSN